MTTVQSLRQEVKDLFSMRDSFAGFNDDLYTHFDKKLNLKAWELNQAEDRVDRMMKRIAD